jgi:hypothetical protein
MDLGGLIRGERRPDPELQRVFTPAGGSGVGPEAPKLRTTIKWDWLRTKLEDVGYIKPEHYEAGVLPARDAGLGAGGIGTLDHAPSAAMSAGAGVAAVASDNPIYGGMYAQMLQRRHGFQIPAARPAHLAEAPVAAMVDEAAPVTAAAATEAAQRVDTPIAAAADDAAARIAALEQRFVEGFQRLGQLPAEQRIPALARAVDAGAAAGHGDDAFGVLATALAERPLEHSVEALHSSIDDALKAAAPKVAEVVEKAAPLADDVAKAAPIIEKAAPVVESVAKAAPVVEQVVEKSAPVLDDVAHAAASVLKPSVVEAALPLGSDALRYGLKGAMGFEAGIDDTLRLLSRVHL